MPHAFVGRAFFALALAAILIAPNIPPATPTLAQGIFDYEVPGGRFYTQGTQWSAGTSPKGFRIVDDAKAKLYSEYSRLGGIVTLGPPTSRRFDYNGGQAQLTRKGAISARSADSSATLLPIMDLLAEAGKDDWALKNFNLPRRVAAPGREYEQIMAERLDWLKASTPIFDFFFLLDDPKSILGAPMSRVEEINGFLVMRFQRGAIRLNKTESVSSGSLDIALVDAGEIARQAGLFPKASFWAESPPPNAPEWTGMTMKGKATWYGADFHGKPMANGKPFNMHDPTLTACNAYPLGTRLKVTSRTGVSIEVTVSDTGGFRYPLVVDLSQAAFRLLGAAGDGTIDVTVEVIGTP